MQHYFDPHCVKQSFIFLKSKLPAASIQNGLEDNYLLTKSLQKSNIGVEALTICYKLRKDVLGFSNLKDGF